MACEATFDHEFAHFVVYTNHRVAYRNEHSHGPQFQSIMKILGYGKDRFKIGDYVQISGYDGLGKVTKINRIRLVVQVSIFGFVRPHFDSCVVTTERPAFIAPDSTELVDRTIETIKITEPMIKDWERTAKPIGTLIATPKPVTSLVNDYTVTLSTRMESNSAFLIQIVYGGVKYTVTQEARESSPGINVNYKTTVKLSNSKA